MKILISIYVISWLILLGIYIGPLFRRICTKEETKKYDEECKIEEEREKLYIQEAMTIYRSAVEESYDNHSSIFSTTAQTLVRKIEKKDYKSVTEHLDKLSFPNGALLLVKECYQSRLGDISRFYFLTFQGGFRWNIWDYIKVENSIDGVWQAYLLYKAWHILPLSESENHERRTYLYSKSDVNNINPMRKKDSSFIHQTATSLFKEPNVVKGDNGKFYVSCCYWSDFKGLIQEIIEINVSPDNSASFKDIAEESLYQYECGIMF